MDSIDSAFNLPIRGKPRGNEFDAYSLAITPERMSDNLASSLVQSIDEGDYELKDWEAEFIGGQLGHSSFSLKQKQVIYKIAKRFSLL